MKKRGRSDSTRKKLALRSKRGLGVTQEAIDVRIKGQLKGLVKLTLQKGRLLANWQGEKRSRQVSPSPIQSNAKGEGKKSSKGLRGISIGGWRGSEKKGLNREIPFDAISIKISASVIEKENPERTWRRLRKRNYSWGQGEDGLKSPASAKSQIINPICDLIICGRGSIDKEK